VSLFTSAATSQEVAALAAFPVDSAASRMVPRRHRSACLFGPFD